MRRCGSCAALRRLGLQLTRRGRRTISVRLIGGVKLDLREAELAAPEVTVTKVSLIGGLNVKVPARRARADCRLQHPRGRKVDLTNCGARRPDAASAGLLGDRRRESEQRRPIDRVRRALDALRS